MSPAVLLPPPAGVHFVEAYHDEVLDTWTYEALPLACIKVHPEEQDFPLDALSVSGQWLGLERGLLLADGRVVVPDEAIYPSVDDWLAQCKAGHEAFMKKRIFLQRA
jgi:hypothetical protein